ncbi:hypothetical protein PtB15_17B192 [Puccinia triticina]|nr:hypothetical protein PtB15_17B192 [Puccinia triticina]
MLAKEIQPNPSANPPSEAAAPSPNAVRSPDLAVCSPELAVCSLELTVCSPDLAVASLDPPVPSGDPAVSLPEDPTVPLPRVQKEEFNNNDLGDNQEDQVSSAQNKGLDSDAPVSEIINDIKEYDFSTGGVFL